MIGEQPVNKVYEDLYWELNKMYSSDHTDSPEETRQAINMLQGAVETHGIPAETIKMKMRQLINKLVQEGTWKPKLHITIHGRFWDKTFVNMVQARRFQME